MIGMQIVTVKSFPEGKDKYGQTKQGDFTTREVEMIVKVYSQSNTNDIRFIDVTNIGLTKDNNIADGNEIIIGKDTYSVIYTIPSGRLHQIFMKKV